METVNSFDILIALIKGCQQNGDDQHIDGPENHDAKIGNLKYLLGQIVRSLWNRKGHKGLSKEAARIWDGLKVGEDIFDYYYQCKVFYKNDVPVHVKGYIGAKSNPDWEEDLKFTKEGDYFRFRQVFHIEHIVPISVILKQLISLDLSEDLDVVYSKIEAILDKIYVCYITKEEDRKLNKRAKTNRPDDYRKVIEGVYKDAGIEVIEWF